MAFFWNKKKKEDVAENAAVEEVVVDEKATEALDTEAAVAQETVAKTTVSEEEAVEETIEVAAVEGQTVEVVTAEEEPALEEKPAKKGFWQRLLDGLTKTRDNFVKNMDYAFRGFTNIDEDFYEELEEILIMGDIGVRTTDTILTELREKVKKDHIKEPMDCKQILIDSIKQQMDIGEAAYEFENRKSVVLVVGVNGVGKTTTIGKLASKLKNQGKKVMVAGADTFRAAAGDQLKEWANRSGVDYIGGAEGADPGAVVYDAIAASKARNVDVLLVDTAGRLHNKKNLMNELHKINTIIEKEYSDAFTETLIVLDGTTGQNALVQAKEFAEVTNISGIVLTKLDGTAKGGIAIAIQAEMGLPVKYIGVGETIDDLEKFNADEFVDALFYAGE